MNASERNQLEMDESSNEHDDYDCLVKNVIEKIGFSSLFDQLDVIAVQGFDANGRVIFWSEGCERMFGYNEAQALGRQFEELTIDDDMQQASVEAFGNWLENDIKVASSERVLINALGEPIHVYSSYLLNKTRKGEKQIYCIDINMDQVRHIESKVRQREMMLKTVFKAIPDLCFLIDHASNILDYHAGEKQNLYIAPEKIIGASMRDVLPKDIAQLFIDNMDKVSKRGGLVSFEYKLTLPHGNCYFEARMNQVPEKDNFIVIIREITQSKEKEEFILHQAHYDALTQLPNRFLSLDRLSQLIEEAKRSESQVALLFIDLDGFKKINDTLGHETGDKCLIEAAKRLKLVVRTEDTVGRLGGDEFIILLRGVCGQNDISGIADSLLKSFRTSFNIDGRELILTLSIGIAVYPTNGSCASTLLRNADTAMYQAKHMGRNTYSYFTEEMNVDLSRRLSVEVQLNNALANHEFEVCYQPQIDVISGKMVGAEALLRWYNPLLGEISPSEFIPIAEKNGLIVSMGQYVLRESLRALKQWQLCAGACLSMAVNLSPRQFRDPLLLDYIQRALVEADVEPQYLELEITEGVLMIGHSYIDNMLSDFRALGIKLSMDDFGTGYSSLSYLRDYAFDIVKVDRSFIRNITEKTTDMDLVSAIVSMAHSLGLKVIAEGVENREQLAILEQLECDYVQGYLFEQPMSLNQLLSLSPVSYKQCKGSQLAN